MIATFYPFASSEVEKRSPASRTFLDFARNEWVGRGVRILYLSLGIISVSLGLIGIFLPILPTVPFMLLAAFFFARSNPAWERRILEHPRFGPPILDWRERGAIGRKAKVAALLALAASAGLGLLLIDGPWRWLPLAIAVSTGTWIATRPS